MLNQTNQKNNFTDKSHQIQQSEQSLDDGQDNEGEEQEMEEEINLLVENIQVSTNNILGIVNYTKWRKNYNYYFGLDIIKGRLLNYKKIDQKKPSTYYVLIKGKFDNKEKGDTEDLIRIQNKKGRKFRLQLYQDKDPEKIKELLSKCFELIVKNQNKGFYANLGRSTFNIVNHPFNITSGIIVNQKCKKHQKKPQQQYLISLSGLFFNQSELLKVILGAISGFIVNPFQKDRLNESMTSFQNKNFLIGLIFKPIFGTIDLIGKSTQSQNEQVIHGNIFMVYKLKKKSKKKMNKKQLKQNQHQKQMTK
ncbi:hypothetical protein IMG5_070620 [Ichthyophthirius multifiliis]|uniref:Uncharacterized protein n=1 Tax=Ichthyophthirius multifiliis TaxID=5932 RepID=G0QPR5_ICHMU|nr:hypothetical protein IMG5_070620 [Ichthyophthirius multifiliis]EGR32780.1 hypothetical protein IMG5_070620 [Ichthyophthirius multifiliis]|eukprot:XP_004036766.1 hypothetical protein IMG5_070620 [Ichthyophthirius multifiliis]